MTVLSVSAVLKNPVQSGSAGSISVLRLVPRATPAWSLVTVRRMAVTAGLESWHTYLPLTISSVSTRGGYRNN